MQLNNSGLVHISTGDLLRQEVKNNTELGIKAQGCVEYMSAGKLVPDEFIVNLVLKRLQQDDVKERGWMLDGFPRTKQQVEQMLKVGIKPTKVVVLELPDEVLEERVLGRRTDPQTGIIYHLKFNPPPNDEVAKRLVHRSDDTAEALKTRMTEYKAQLEPIKSNFGAWFTVDASKDKHEVFQKVSEYLDERPPQ